MSAYGVIYQKERVVRLSSQDKALIVSTVMDVLAHNSRHITALTFNKECSELVIEVQRGKYLARADIMEKRGTIYASLLLNLGIDISVRLA